MEKRLFINGKVCISTILDMETIQRLTKYVIQYIDARTSSRLTLHNPGDGSLIASDVHVAEEADVNAAVAAARAAFPLWASKDPSERAAILNKFADAIEANAQELGRLETLPSGKPTSRVQMVELKLAAQYFRCEFLNVCFPLVRPFPTRKSRLRFPDYAGWCDKLHGEATPVTNGFVRIVTHEPFGVCACICPFNAPVVMACTKLAPALAAGNTAVIKPSEKTPLSTIFLGRLANEAGIPAGVLNVVTGAGPTGALLASHMDVNKISFTGSCATGKKIAQMAAGTNLKRVSLELGGKSPSIIFPDANLDVAVEWCVRGITTMTGQVCMASSRVYVHKSIRDKFVQRFQAALKTVASTIGDPSLGSTTVGPLVDKLQFERVMSLIDSGKKEAKLLQGGQQIGDKVTPACPAILRQQGLTISRDILSNPQSLSRHRLMPEFIRKRSLVQSSWSANSKMKKR